jgi:aldose 1-epimerase
MISIAYDEFSAEILPHISGGLAYFRYRGIDLLRPVGPEALGNADPFGLACFPMVPFVGRIRGGRFGDVVLAPNHPVEAYPLHGHGWRKSWEIAGHQADNCWLNYRHQSDDWPWNYAARLLYRLSECGLTMLLTVRNLSDRSMPVGLGQHPYFPRHQGCRIETNVARVLWPSEDLVADETGPVPAEWGFDPVHEVGSVPLDHGFTGWRGAAEIVWDDHPVRLRVTASAGGRFLQVYAPPGADFFCLEPMTSVPNAVNWKGGAEESGLCLLAPGAAATLECQFSVRIGTGR